MKPILLSGLLRSANNSSSADKSKRKIFVSKVFIFSFLTMLASFVAIDVKAQIQLISASDGGFESGTTTFAANGWTEVQPGNARQWWVGNAAGSSGGSNSAYMGANNNNNGTRTTSVQHFYRDITIPAGASSAALTFKFQQTNTDNGNDIFYVFTTTTSNTPVSGTVPGAGYTQRFTNTATTYGSFTSIPSIDLSALIGTTVRLVFTHKANGSNPAANPAVDDIQLSYMPPAPTITSYTPSSGCGLSTSITINGTNLSSASSVTIGGTAVSSITSNTATQIVAVIGSGTTGTVSVTTAGGTANGAGTFTVNAAPTAYNVTGGGTICSTSSGTSVGLSGSQSGVNYQLYIGGVASGAPVAGTGAAISFGLQTTAGTYTVIATNTTSGCTRTQTGSVTITVNTAPSISVNPSTQSVCIGSSVTFSVTASGTSPTYQWRKNGSNIGGATSSSYTIASAVAGDAANYDVVVSVASCTSVTSTTATLTVNTLPNQYNMSGGGNICSTSSGVAVGVNNSQSGVNYQLYIGGVASGSPVAGTGSAISFGLQTTNGTYTAVGTNATTGCTRTMNGSSVVTVYTAPSISVNPVSQDKCVGSSVTFSVTASGTSPTYQWRKNGTNIGGATSSSYTIASVVVGSAGNYDVVVSVANCSSVTSTVAVLTVGTIPNAYNVTGGGSYCSTGSGVAVGLSNSQTSVNYQLYVGGVATGSPVAGTGAAISFGLQTAAGTYTVVATNTVAGCTRNQTGSATVTIITAPSISANPSSQAICLGSSVTFSVTASGSSPTYQWRKNGVNIGGATSSSYTIASVAAGDAANYDVVVSVAGCSSVTSTAATLSINSLPTVYSVTGGGTACSSVTVGLSGSQSGVNYTLSPSGTIIAGTGAAISFGGQTSSGTYTASATNATTGCTSSMSGSAVVTITGGPTFTTQPTDQVACVGNSASFTVASASSGLSYQWKKGTTNISNGGTISGATTATLTISSVVAGDAATDYNCEITNSCGSETSDYVSLTVGSTASSPTTQPTSIAFPTIGVTSIIGTFSASTTATHYLVVRTTTASAPSSPSDGTTYAVGSTALGATTYVEYAGTDSTFSSNGLSQGTTYYFWVYAYNVGSCGTSPKYYTVSPLNGSATTTTNISCGSFPILYWAGSGSSYTNGSATTNFNTASNWSTSSSSYVASGSAPTGCTNVSIAITSANVTLALSGNLSVYDLTFTSTGGYGAILNTAGYTLTVNGTGNVDVDASAADNTYVGIGDYSGLSGIVDFKANFSIGTNASAWGSGKASYLIGNNNSKITFRGDVLFGRTCIISSSFRPGTVEFDGVGLQEVLWNNDMYFANFRNVVIGNVNNPICRHVTGTYTPDNILGNLTINGSSTLDLATSQWIRNSSGGTFAVNGTAKLILGNDHSIVSPANGQGVIVAGSNFPGGFNTITLSGTSTIEYDADSSLNQTIYATPTYGNLTMTNSTGSGTADRITTGVLTISGTTQVKNGVTFTPGANITSNGAFQVKNGGKMICASYIVSGSGSFALESGGTISIGSNSGITSSGATGNIQTTTRTFSTGGNYIYLSTGATNTGNGLPTTVNNLTISNSSGVTLYAAGTTYTVNGTLSLTSGAFVINGNTLSVNTVTRNSGSLKGSSTSGLTVNSTSTPMYFTSGGRILKNLTMSTNATGTLLTDLELPGGNSSTAGTLTLGAGSNIVANGHLYLRSTSAGSARVAEIPVNGSGVALASITGDIQVERYISARKAWRMLSVTTSGSQTINAAWQEGQAANSTTPAGYGIQITGPNFPNGFDLYTATPALKTFDAATNSWTTVTSTLTPFTDKAAYMVFIRGDRTVNSFGQAPTSTILRTRGSLFMGNQSSVSVSANTFKAMANPYASSINFKNVSKSGVDDKYYVWDPNLGSLGGYQTFVKNGSGDYEVVLGGGSYGAAGTVYNEIQNGQAFMVYSTGTSGTVSLEENDKSNGQVSVSRGADDRLGIRQLRTLLYAVNANGITSLIDGVLNQYGNDYSNDIDAQDAVKSVNLSENLSVKRDNKTLVVERRQELTEADTIQYNLAGTRVQQYKFQFIPGNLSVQGLTAYLEDSYLNTRQQISLEDTAEYTFSIANIPGSYAQNRFRIVFAQSRQTAITAIAVNRERDNTNHVDWTVENEAAIEHYELQRSADSINFISLSETLPLSNDFTTNNYNAVDRNPLRRDNYYRVKGIKFNGSEIYSAIVRTGPVRGLSLAGKDAGIDELKNTLTGNLNNGISVYPNPVVNKQMQLRFANQKQGIYTVDISNKLGETVLRKTVSVNGNQTITFLLENSLSSGNYQLRITSPDNSVRVIQVMIQ